MEILLLVLMSVVAVKLITTDIPARRKRVEVEDRKNPRPFPAYFERRRWRR